MPRNALTPVRLLRSDAIVKVLYLDQAAPVYLDARKPVEALATCHNDDTTLVECVDDTLLAVRQIDEFGTAQTVMLSPRMAAELTHVIDSFLVLGPTGDKWRDGRKMLD